MTATRRALLDVGALVLALAALVGAFTALEKARTKGDPRRTIARSIRREASSKDLVIVLDEAPELVALVRPAPGLWGTPPLDDITGVRRLYVMAPAEASLAPMFARFGPAAPFRGEARARRWDIKDAHLGRVLYEAIDEIGTGIQARRVGGADAGPCPADAGRLVCNGAPWNQVVVEPHRFEGAELRCVFAHPQADGSLVLELTNIPPAHAIAGVIGIDDAGFHPGAAAVHARLEYRPEGSAPLIRELVAHNRRGLTPWRVSVPHKAAAATLTVTTPNAGARQFCFTLVATE